jgi:hypothetical protein
MGITPRLQAAQPVPYGIELRSTAGATKHTLAL